MSKAKATQTSKDRLAANFFFALLIVPVLGVIFLKQKKVILSP